MKPTPIVYVTDMGAAISFYATLSPTAVIVSSSPYWTELDVAGASVALHLADNVSAGTDLRVALAFSTEDTLEQVAERLAAAGIPLTRDIADEPFGRSLVVADPDGLLLQVNEHRTELGDH